MLTFLILFGVLLLINVFIFLFSRNKIEEIDPANQKVANYEEEVGRLKSTPTTPQFQDA